MAANLRLKAAAAGRAQRLPLRLCRCCSKSALAHPVTAHPPHSCPPHYCSPPPNMPPAHFSSCWPNCCFLPPPLLLTDISYGRSVAGVQRLLQHSCCPAASWPEAPVATEGPGASSALLWGRELAEGCGKSWGATPLQGKQGEP